MSDELDETAHAPMDMPSFAIGVTGHRDLRDTEVPEIRAAIADKIGLVAQKFDYMPVTLITGLAEGADTVAAQVALELGISVHAVLPMPREFYLDDFESDARNEIEALLTDDRIMVSEIPLKNGVDIAGIAEQSARDVQYALLMDYIRRRSNIVLALWDGQVSGLQGGTSDVVLGYLGGDARMSNPIEIPADPTNADTATDLVVWVPVSRQSNPNTVSAGPTCLISNPTGDCYWHAQDIPAAILSRWKGLDDYARERASDRGAELTTYPLLNSATKVSPDARNIEQEYLRTDQLARANQVQSDFMFKLFGVVAAAMGLFFLVYAKLWASKYLLMIYIALFLVGFLAFRVSAGRHWLGKHLSYRALAETLRVQFFLTLSEAGDGFGIRRILMLTNVNSFERFDWLQDAVRCCEPLVYFSHVAPDVALGLVQENWVEDQAKYFRKKHHTMHGHHARLEIVKTLLLIGSVLGAFALIFFKKQLLHLEMIGYDGKALLVFFMGLLPLWVAVWELYQGKMATRELIWQYTQQERIFRAAVQPIQNCKQLSEAQRMVADLAEKALVEIYMWSVHRYHREHEPPAAG